MWDYYDTCDTNHIDLRQYLNILFILTAATVDFV